MPPQIVRLVLLTVAIVGSYLVAKYFLTPPSFGKYGFYRGDALMEIAARPISLAGRKACADCHYDQSQQLAKFSHKTLSCEVCHGFGQAHVAGYAQESVAAAEIKMPVLSYGHCARCHEANPSRPKWFKQINLRDHYSGDKCTECHVPHAPSEVP